MTVRDFLKVLRARWVSVLVLSLIGVLAGVAVVVTSTKEYESTAQIFVSTASADSATAADLAQGNNFTQARVQSYTSVAHSPAVTKAVIASLDLRMSFSELASQITADAPLDKVLINVHVRDHDPVLAARLANAVAAQFTKVIADLEQTSADTPSPVKLTVTQPAEVPSSSVSPRTKLDVAIGLLVGLVLGLALALLRELLDNTVKNPVDLFERTALPVLGIVPWDKKTPSSPISFRADAHGARAESFRQMSVNLQFVDVDHPPKVIAVTSAMPGEGKTHTALNLACSLAEAGKRVCLIEADLRKPSLARALGLVGDVGVTSVLVGHATIEDVLQNVGHNLAVMTSGSGAPNPSELLNSEAFGHLVSYVRSRVDIVIIDTAPLLPVVDGAQIASLVDATLLTVRASKTTNEQLRRAVETLANVGVTPVGVVLNMASRRGRTGYAYYYQDYRPDQPTKSTRSIRATRAAKAAAGSAERDREPVR